MSTVNLIWAVTAIMATVISGFAAVGTLLWKMSAKWTDAVATMRGMNEDIHDLVSSKEREHTRLESRIDRVEQRMERHESWHAQRGMIT